ncbi:DUF4363 family protein [Crassaminicella profunda]|uniref:DUF4363 family protein n=1 Tax=Crassaminicella profunda TaxID=1286698 RepID=UPI001CA6BE31|nr:DUF4363 family protein [Crassaminicella profunda]QZY55579.1 DUF4363 family protein [Crassaminicella profunda]
MRVLIIATLAVLLVIGGWALLYDTINDGFTDLTNTLSKVSENIETQDWQIAYAKLSKTNEKWQSLKDFLPLFVDHREIHKIDLIMTRANIYLKKKNTPLSLAEIEALKAMLTMLKDEEVPNLINIL